MRYQWQPRQTSFHLRALAGLVEHESSTGKYQLTDAGQMAISLIEDFQFLAEKTRQMKLGAPVNYVRNLALGDHSLLLYDAETFKREISFSFLKEGLSKHQAALYCFGKQTRFGKSTSRETWNNL